MALELAVAYVSIIPETSRIRPEVQRAFQQAEPVAAQAGRAHGQAYAAGFRSPLRGIASAFVASAAAAGAVVRNARAIALGVALATRAARGLSVSLLASASLLGRIAGAGLGRLAVVLRLLGTLASRLAREIRQVAAAMIVLQAVGRLVSGLNNIAKAMSRIVIGASLAIGVVSALGTTFAVMGAAVGAAAGAAAGAIVGILGPAIAALKVGFKGLGDAAKAYTSSDGGASQAKAVAAAAKQIESAEKGVERAKRDSRDAERDLTRARKDAEEQIEDLNLALKGAALSEKDAQLSLLEARRDLQNLGKDGEPVDMIDRERAVLRVQEAEQRLAETRESNGDLAEQTAEANRLGVEGSDQVVQAKQRVVDANEAVVEAVRQVAEAQQAMIDAQSSGQSGVDPFDAMIGQRMAPLLDAAKNLKHAVTDEFSAALAPAFSMFGGLLDNLSPKLAALSGVFGEIGNQIAASLSGPAGVAAFDQMTAASNQFFTALSAGENGLGGLSLGFTQFAATAASTVAGTGTGVNEMLLGWGEALRNISADQIREVFAQIGQVFSNIASVAGPLFELFREVGQVSATALAPGFRAVGAAITQATPGLVQMAQTLMPALSQVMQNLAPAIPAIVQAFQPWASILAAIAPHLASLAADLAPMAPYILAAAGAVKLINLAMIAYSASTFGASIAQGVFAAATGRGTAAIAGNTIALGAHRAALLAGTIASRAFGAAMAFITGPVGLIIAAIAAVVAGLVWFFTQTETGKRVWETVWNGIKTAMSAAWAFLKPILEAVVSFFTDTLAPAVMWFWNNVIEPAFQGIKFAFQVWWAAVNIVFELWKRAFQIAGDVVMWLWRNIIEPAFNAIGAVISTVWSSVLEPIWSAFKAALEVVGNVVSWLWREVFEPGFAAIGKVVSKAWDFVKPVFEKFGAGIQAIGDIASKIGGTIKSAFDGLVNILKKPIHVIGGLLAKIPTSILRVDIPGAGTIRSWGESMQRLRDGGRVAGRTREGLLWGPGTGTSDSILGVDGRGMATALVSTGEYVSDEKTTKRWGWLLERLPKLRTGGPVQRDRIPWLNIEKPKNWVEQRSDRQSDRDGDTEVRPDVAAQQQTQQSSNDGSGELGGGTVNQSIWDAVRAKFPDATLNSGYRAGDPGFHGIKKAVDVGGPMQAIADYMFGSYKTDLAQIIWNNGPVWYNVRKNELGTGVATAEGQAARDIYGPGTMAGHADHVHLAAEDPLPGSAVKPTDTVDSTSSSSSTLDSSYSSDLSDLDLATTSDSTTSSSSTSSTSSDRPTTISGMFGDLASTFAKSFVEGQLQDVFGVFGIPDSPSWLQAYNEFRSSSDEFYGNKSGSYSTSSGTEASTSDLSLSAVTADEPSVNTQRPAGGQDGYAFDITKVAKDMGFGKDGAVIGIATALVESTLKMYANSNVPESLQRPHDAVGSDHDSVGLFQQRYPMWGPLDVLMDPTGSARLFYDALGKIDWKNMAPGDAAQAVQRSAFPSRYAGQMSPAADWVARTKLFDTGGVMNPGDIGINLLKKPEVWLNPDEKATIEQIAGLDLLPGGGDGATGDDFSINIQNLHTGISKAEFDRSIRELKAEQRLRSKSYMGSRR